MSEDSKLQVNSERLTTLKKEVDNAFLVAELLPNGNNKPFEIVGPFRNELSEVIATTAFEASNYLGISDVKVGFSIEALSSPNIVAQYSYTRKDDGSELRTVILNQDYLWKLTVLAEKSSLYHEIAKEDLRQNIAHEF